MLKIKLILIKFRLNIIELECLRMIKINKSTQ